MDLLIFNRDLDYLGIIDTFSSLRWVRRYNKSGEFELHCPLTQHSLELLKRENIIYKKEDNEAGYIETRQLGLNSSGEETLQIRGEFLTNYLDRRIIWDMENLNTTNEKAMRYLVDKNCINTRTERRIPFLDLDREKYFIGDIQKQVSYKNLLEELENISNTSDLGYRINFEYKSKKLLFEVYKGLDRTADQKTNAPAIFSKDFENILEQNFVDSLNNYKNVAYVAGAGEGAERKFTTIGNSSSLDRYELFVDARDLQNTEQKEEIKKDEDGNETKETVDVPIPWEKYEPLLLQRGNEKLAECQQIQTFDSKINIRSNLRYKEDFNLGDLVTCIDRKWGIRLDSRIVEVEEIYEGNEISVNIILGNNIPTLIDKIKQRMR